LYKGVRVTPMQNVLVKSLFLATALICAAACHLYAEIPAKVTVSLPVQAAVEGVTLQPGTYVMAIENFDGSKAGIKVFRSGSSELLVTAPVTTAELSAPAARNAVKVVTREGAYYLDKLLLAGEKTAFQFR
jgi:hypothetical protein